MHNRKSQLPLFLYFSSLFAPLSASLFPSIAQLDLHFLLFIIFFTNRLCPHNISHSIDSIVDCTDELLLALWQIKKTAERAQFGFLFYPKKNLLLSVRLHSCPVAWNCHTFVSSHSSTLFVLLHDCGSSRRKGQLVLIIIFYANAQSERVGHWPTLLSWLSIAFTSSVVSPPRPTLFTSAIDSASPLPLLHLLLATSFPPLPPPLLFLYNWALTLRFYILVVFSNLQ